ncbi:LysM peptidoglycan-binding domain-containing protein [Paenibacillus thalictri]|uniref:LysM peptidoglycan-binding domain-containing protein n=1 Tax=Paenibacillus thalictri TaxID=2527873 RepID=A0A4V2J3D8_9BACL|nr:LysM peptidoglycan-binding domain-containing protein [Paenibacillus thalictri]TBL71362.1 LysM peptidoglycan-binding domain-containing protein [Paenibacillus thalictri]
MDIFFIDSTGDWLWLPVNPGEISIKREKQLETVNVMRFGEIDFPQAEKVKDISFSSFFPKVYDSSYCRYQPVPDPQQAMNRLNDLMLSKRPVQLLITDTDVNVFVLVSAHSSTFRGGEPGDVYFDLTCRTWREAKVRTAEEAASGSLEARLDLQPVPQIYEVAENDTLWTIAKRLYGNGNRYTDIYQANQALIGPSPDWIRQGQRLVIPQ